MRTWLTRCEQAGIGRRRLLWLVAGLISCGCSSSVEFAADTQIDAAGNVVRTTRLESSGGASFDQLQTRYELPPGGEWTESVDEQPPARAGAPARRVYRWTYSLTRRFAPGEQITGDFRRLGVQTGLAAENDIAIRSRRLWFVDSFSYRETFGDIPTLESVTDAIDRFYSLMVGLFAEEISDLDETLTQVQARDRLTQRFDPLLESIEAALQTFTHCIDVPAGADDCRSRLENDGALQFAQELFNDDEVLLSELAGIFPAPESVAEDDWLEALQGEVMDDVEIRADRLLDEIWIEEMEEDVFGAHGLALFVNYPFELSVSLPGQLVATNADSDESGVLRWSFDEGDFWLRDRTLSASSRIVHRSRIVLAVTVLLLAGIVVLNLALRRRRSQLE